MRDNELMKGLGFSDLGRLLQQTSSQNTTTGSLSENFNVAAGCLFMVLILVAAILLACIKMGERRENIVGGVPELPTDIHKTPKSTLAGRKRAILELFETSDVTMVSHDQTEIWQKATE
jgi:hypothetical protein